MVDLSIWSVADSKIFHWSRLRRLMKMIFKAQLRLTTMGLKAYRLTETTVTLALLSTALTIVYNPINRA